MDKQLSSQAEQTVEVATVDGKTETLTLRPMPVARYAKAYQAFTSGDLVGLVALYANKPKGWTETLEPPSLTLLLTAVMEGNPDFFAFAVLQQKLANGIRLEPSPST